MSPKKADTNEGLVGHALDGWKGREVKRKEGREEESSRLTMLAGPLVSKARVTPFGHLDPEGAPLLIKSDDQRSEHPNEDGLLLHALARSFGDPIHVSIDAVDLRPGYAGWEEIVHFMGDKKIWEKTFRGDNRDDEGKMMEGFIRTILPGDKFVGVFDVIELRGGGVVIRRKGGLVQDGVDVIQVQVCGFPGRVAILGDRVLKGNGLRRGWRGWVERGGARNRVGRRAIHLGEEGPRVKGWLAIGGTGGTRLLRQG